MARGAEIPTLLIHLYAPRTKGRRRPIAGGVNGRLRDGVEGSRVEKGDRRPITHALGYTVRATFLRRWMWTGAGAGSRRNVGAINRFISYFGDPVIRAPHFKLRIAAQVGIMRKVDYLALLPSATQSVGFAA